MLYTFPMGKTKKNLLLIALPLMGLTLSSCTIFDLIFSSKSSEKDWESDFFDGTSIDFDRTEVAPGLYKPNDFYKVSSRDLGYNRGMDLAPSTGDVNVLVLPIEFTDFPFSPSTLSNLETALNGNGSEDTGYWESLSSFYRKSSFGQLRLDFHVADVFKTGLTTTSALRDNLEYETLNQSENINGQKWINDAVKSYSDARHPLTDFDSDNDGIIDAVIAVYSCPNYTNRSYYYTYKNKSYLDGKTGSSLFWAFTYWCANSGDLANPKANTYVWLSYDFFLSSDGRPDPHTAIHEYGHAMGLDDYYSNEETFQPAGGIDMMDMNIVDHDVYSKAALGWVIPEVVDGDDVTVSLKPSQESGQCILIPPENYNGTLWDEYILIELYTPDGLNEHDSLHVYSGRPRGYTIPGLKIYHIDSRILEFKLSSNFQSVVSTRYVRDVNSINPTSMDSYFMVGATNCSKEFNASQISPSNKSYSSDFSLIHLIEATGVNTFSMGKFGTNLTLFTEGSSFSLERYGNAFFPRGDKLNGGSAFPYTVSVDALNSAGATLHITKAQ